MNLWTYRHTHLPASVFLKFGHELLLCEGKVSFQAQLVLFLTIRYSMEIKTVIQLCITSWSRLSLLVPSGYCQSRGTTIYHSEWSSMVVQVFHRVMVSQWEKSAVKYFLRNHSSKTHVCFWCLRRKFMMWHNREKMKRNGTKKKLYTKLIRKSLCGRNVQIPAKPPFKVFLSYFSFKQRREPYYLILLLP